MMIMLILIACKIASINFLSNYDRDGSEGSEWKGLHQYC